MFNSNSAWNWWNFVHNMHVCDNPLFYIEIILQTSFLYVNCYNLSANLVNTIQKLTFVTFELRFSYNHTRSCRVVAYRKHKTKEYIKFLAQKVVAVGNLGSGRLRKSFWNSVWLRNKRINWKVVAYGRWSLTRSGRYERVDCISLRRPNFPAGQKKNGGSEYRLVNDKSTTYFQTEFWGGRMGLTQQRYDLYGKGGAPSPTPYLFISAS